MVKTRLISYMNVSVASAMGMFGLSSHADAGVVFFDVNPDLPLESAVAHFGNINLDAGTYTIGSTSGNSFSFDTTDARVDTFSSSNIFALGDFGTYSVSLYRGNIISGSLEDPAINGRGFFATMTHVTQGDDEATGPTFLPLRLDAGSGNYNYGWVQVFGFGSNITITGFAFERDLNTPILAGDTGSSAAIPEPGSLAVISGLFGLLVATNRRARKQSQPSMPDALMDLASGAKGVETLRASRIA